MKSLSMLKQRKPLLLLGGAIAGLVAGGVAAVWFISHRPVPIAELPAGADIVPQDAIATVSFSTDPGQWRRLRAFGTPETQAALDQQLVELRDRFLTENGFNYQRDLQPWIGEEMTIAILAAPEAADGQSSAESSAEGERPIALVLPIADPAEAQQVLADRLSPEDQVTERTYKGVQIRDVRREGKDAYSATVLDNRYVVLTQDNAAIEALIDTYKGEASIAKIAGYGEAFRQVAGSQPFARIYVNAPAVKAITTANTEEPNPLLGITPLQNNQGVAATATLNADGIRLQVMNWLPANSRIRYAARNTADQMPDLLPADTLLMISGGSFNQFWENYRESADGNSRGLENPVNLQEGIRSTTGLDLDRDLVSWMQGEFSLSLIPAVQGETATAGVVLLVQASDRTAADQALTRLDEVMRDRYGFQVSSAEVEGQPVMTWKSPFEALSITRGWLNDGVAFLALNPAVVETILPQSERSLASASSFQEATSSDLASNSRFFIDIDRLFRSESPVPVPNLPPSSRNYVEAIRAIGGTTAFQGDRATRYDINILLRKGNSPRPLPSPKS